MFLINPPVYNSTLLSEDKASSGPSIWRLRICPPQRSGIGTTGLTGQELLFDRTRSRDGDREPVPRYATQQCQQGYADCGEGDADQVRRGAVAQGLMGSAVSRRCEELADWRPPTSRATDRPSHWPGHVQATPGSTRKPRGKTLRLVDARQPQFGRALSLPI